MKLGISTACFYPMPIENTLSLIYKAGFSAAEIFLNCASECEGKFARELRHRADSEGIEIISVHSFTSAIETFLLFSSYERRTQEGIDTLKKVMDAALILGANFITFHGKRIGVGEKTSDEHYCEVLHRLFKEASERDLVLAQENVSWCESSSPEFLRRIKSNMPDGELKFTLDIKQTKRALRPIDDYIEVMGKDIVNIHINDFSEESGCLLPGKGEMDYVSFLKKVKSFGYDGALITEVYSHNFQTIDDLKNSRLFLEEQISKA